MPTDQKPLTKSAAAVLVALTIAAIAGCCVWLAIVRTNVVPLQMAGSADKAACLISSRPISASASVLPACQTTTTATRNQYHRTVLLDGLLIIAYGVALVISNYLGWQVAWTKRLKMVAWAGLWLGVGAVVLNIAQDIFLLVALAHSALPGDWIFRIIQALAFAKFSTLAAALVIGICALSTTLRRLTHSEKESQRNWPEVIPPPPVEHPSDAEETARSHRSPDPNPAGETARAEAQRLDTLAAQMEAQAEKQSSPLSQRQVREIEEAVRIAADKLDADAEELEQKAASPVSEHWRRMANVPPGRKPAEMGICVSGGGVRSATVALGALQSLRDGHQLEQASYLVSVSGGGYISGAFQLALTPSGQPSGTTGTATPGDVFAPGSVEEDHVRRHGSYLADDLGQWVRALGILFRNLLGSFVILGLVVTVLGITIGSFYRATKIAALENLLPRFLTRCGPTPSPGQGGACPHLAKFPSPSVGVTLAVGAMVGLALLAYVIPRLWPPPKRVGAVWSQEVARVILAVGGLLAVIGIALPAIVWASAWVSYHVGLGTQGEVVSAATATGFLSYAGVLAAVLWRKKKPIGQKIGGVLKKAQQGQLLPSSMVQSLVIWICLVVLCVALLLVSGWVASSPWSKSLWALLPVAALLVAGLTLDQTWLSLHPFYRSRLASAFAVRRIDRDGEAIATPYDYTIRTKLSSFAKRVEPHPKVIFAAAANIKGDELTPPGRDVVSFTMADDYVGGAQVGWVPTKELEDLVAQGYLARDLTVEAAVAISGAAVASAMGRQTRYYELFLCLANLRLGAWLPNPRFVWLKRDHKDDWTFPGLPSRRHLNYLAREIFNVHHAGSPLLLCTDGGHYENLGLVELLRHKCRIIYCIDATGDTPPLATTLAQAIALAREELGIKITPRVPLDLMPGGATGVDPGLAELAPRMSRDLVCVADIVYPEDIEFYNARGEATRTTNMGILIVAKTSLTPTTPYPLLSFSLEDKAFPRDSTGDQWFNGDQFDAYQQLGVVMGDRALEAAHTAGVIDDHHMLIQ